MVLDLLGFTVFGYTASLVLRALAYQDIRECTECGEEIMSEQHEHCHQCGSDSLERQFASYTDALAYWVRWDKNKTGEVLEDLGGRMQD